MESSPRNISFTTNNFTHFGNAKEKKHSVDLNLFHECLFPCLLAGPLSLSPFPASALSLLHLFFFFYPPACPSEVCPLEVGFFSVLYTLSAWFITPTGMPSATINFKIYISSPNFPSELQLCISNCIFTYLQNLKHILNQTCHLLIYSSLPNLLYVLPWLTMSPPF